MKYYHVFLLMGLSLGLGCSAGGETAVSSPDEAPEPEVEEEDERAIEAQPRQEPQPEPVRKASFEWITVEEPRKPRNLERPRHQRRPPPGKCYTAFDCRRQNPDADTDFRCDAAPYCSGPGECVPLEGRRGDQGCGDMITDYCDCSGRNGTARDTCELPDNLLYPRVCGNGPDKLPPPQKEAALEATTEDVHACAREYLSEQYDGRQEEFEGQPEVTVALRIGHWEDDWSFHPRGGVVTASRLVKDQLSPTGEVGDCIRKVMADAAWPTPLGMHAEFEKSFVLAALNRRE